MSVFVVGAFVRMRIALAGTRDVARMLAELERRIAGHNDSIRTLLAAIRQLMVQPDRARRRIGFRVEERRPVYRKPRRVRIRVRRGWSRARRLRVAYGVPGIPDKVPVPGTDLTP